MTLVLLVLVLWCVGQPAVKWVGVQLILSGKFIASRTDRLLDAIIARISIQNTDTTSSQAKPVEEHATANAS